MTAPNSNPAERETPAGEMMRKAVEPTAGALKLARQNGGVNGELCERMAWALDPEAFQIWEREHQRKHPDSEPTWDQMAVHGRRARARATASSLVAGPIASELARLTAERDEARARAELWGDWIADAYELLNDACMTTDADDRVEPGIIAATRRACANLRTAEAALTTIRADHATEIARLETALTFYADDANYRLNGPLCGENPWFTGSNTARAALANPETTDV